MEDIKDFVDMESAAADLEDTGDLLDSEDDAPIIRLLNAILAESLKKMPRIFISSPMKKSHWCVSGWMVC